MTRLPEDFLSRMEALLKDEYPEFLQTFKQKRFYGLRANTLKISPVELKALVPFNLLPVPWAAEGFYYAEDDDPGKHHFHSAGLYYIQEPSAMAPGAVLDVKSGERVLDVCAAPGGKTTQIGAALQGSGFVVANDLSLKRAQVLAMNIERMGLTNSFVTQENPKRLEEYFWGYFDRILVDAPCSGEGMFRKMPEALEHWSVDYLKVCAGMQREILESAAVMLKPGGIMVYSTCTFAPEENEGTVETFIQKHPEFELTEIPQVIGFQTGHPEWVKGRAELKRTVRLWPHHLNGEGHFVAKLRKIAGKEREVKSYHSMLKDRDLKPYVDFCIENLYTVPHGEFTLFGNHLYLTPEGIPDFAKMKVLRPGWYLGEMKKDRFEPAHGLAVGLKAHQVKRVIALTEPAEIAAYLRGETLRSEGEKGWTLITVNGYPLGWGKVAQGIVKNHYPRNMRWFF